MILGEPITLKPVGHLRKEDGSLLHPDGERVIASSYWLRRLENGDVIEVTEAKPSKTKD